MYYSLQKSRELSVLIQDTSNRQKFRHTVEPCLNKGFVPINGMQGEIPHLTVNQGQHL